MRTSPLAAALACALVATAALASPPCAITVSFGADPTTSATVSFSSNSSDAAAFLTISPPVGGATRISATRIDNSYANSAGVRFVYRAALTGLLPSTTYTYAASVLGVASATRTFTTLSADPAAVPKVIFWGDLGRDGGGQAIPALEAEAAATAARAPGAGDVGIQAGDFAYDLGDMKGARGAAFMERYSAIAGSLPTFTCIGNHVRLLCP